MLFNYYYYVINVHSRQIFKVNKHIYIITYHNKKCIKFFDVQNFERKRSSTN